MESDAPAAPAAITLTLAELRALIEDIVDERLAEVAREDGLEFTEEIQAGLIAGLACRQPGIPAEAAFELLERE